MGGSMGWDVEFQKNVVYDQTSMNLEVLARRYRAQNIGQAVFFFFFFFSFGGGCSCTR